MELKPGEVIFEKNGVDSILVRPYRKMRPKLMVDGAQSLENDCGPLRIIAVRYRKVMLAIYRGTRHIVMLSFEPKIETPFLDKLATGLESIVH